MSSPLRLDIPWNPLDEQANITSLLDTLEVPDDIFMIDFLNGEEGYCIPDRMSNAWSYDITCWITAQSKLLRYFQADIYDLPQVMEDWDSHGFVIELDESRIRVVDQKKPSEVVNEQPNQYSLAVWYNVPYNLAYNNHSSQAHEVLVKSDIYYTQNHAMSFIQKLIDPAQAVASKCRQEQPERFFVDYGLQLTVDSLAASGLLVVAGDGENPRKERLHNGSPRIVMESAQDQSLPIKPTHYVGKTLEDATCIVFRKS